MAGNSWQPSNVQDKNEGTHHTEQVRGRREGRGGGGHYKLYCVPTIVKLQGRIKLMLNKTAPKHQNARML